MGKGVLVRRAAPSRLRALWRRDDGVAALEFALVAPCMFLFVVGVFDISKALILDQEVYNAAHTIPVSASVIAVQSDKTTALTDVQVQQSMSAIFAEIPWIRSGMENGTKSITMSSITFEKTSPSCVPTSNNCTYVPYAAWSVAYVDPSGRYPSNANTFQNVVRPCTFLNQTAPTNGASGDLASLRTLNVVNPNPILVVDVHYRYKPFFLNFITGPLDFWASGYWPVRSVAPSAAYDQQYTKYVNTTSPSGTSKCPGYS